MDSFLELNLGVKEVFEEFVSVAKKKDFVLTSIELIFFKKKKEKEIIHEIVEIQVELMVEMVLNFFVVYEK